MREEVVDIPLFPVDVVLFPGMQLPLRVSTEPDRLMINECLEGNGQLGIVLARSAVSEGAMSGAYPVGTSARITRVDVQEDGSLDVQISGLERFRILHVRRTERYAVGRIGAFPLEDIGALGVPGQVQTVSQLFVEYLRLVGEVLGVVIRIETSLRDPCSLAYLVAVALLTSSEEKQELLSVATLPALLSREAAIMHREELLLNRMRLAQDSDLYYVKGITAYHSLS